MPLLAHNLQTSSRSASPAVPTLSMRLVLSLLVLCCCCAARLTAAELTAVRIWPSYRSAESFERISEFIDGRENTGGQTLLRSQPESREGFYFLTRIKNTGASLEGVRFELSVITANSALPKTFTNFPATSIPAAKQIPQIDLNKRGRKLSTYDSRGSHVFQIGLTGSDWPDSAANPVAWQLRLLSADGQELLREQSFLWSQPAKN
jgi:hypothetical protein